MRTVKTIKAGIKNIEDYYTEDESLTRDEYYSESEMEADELKVTTAQWMGSKSPSRGLSGSVAQEKFKKLFYGYLPDTEQRMRGKPTQGRENLAVDMTLSAPKSFSLHALVDLRLFDAHMSACKRTLAAAEQYYCFQRKYIDGKQINVRGDGFIAAAIPHWTSREMQAQLHTHLVVFNGCQGADGKWRAFDDRQFSYAEWLGSYYRNELAKLTQELGYKIHEEKNKDGSYSFEIDGISREQIEHFSKRTEQIEKAKAKGLSKEEATLKTRKSKDVTKTWQEFRADSLKVMDEVGVKLQTPSSAPLKRPIGKTDATAAVESAVRHLSTRSVKFTQEDILKFTLDHMQRYALASLEKAIAAHPELIDYGAVTGNEGYRNHYTTATALERETRTIQAWMKGQGLATPIMKSLDAAQSLEGIQLKTGQRAAVIGVLASNNQNLVIHGLSGVGKTTALRQLKELCDHSSVEVLGFAPSIEAAKKLSSELGIETYTVQKLVYTDFPIKRGQLLIVDEAGMASAEMMDILMEKAQKAGARVLLVGDTGQNQAVEAGSPMRSLMAHGAETHHIAEIIRQQNSIQNRAVGLIAKNQGSDGLALLTEHGYITEIAGRTERTQAIAQAFLDLSPEEQAKTLIVAGTNAEKDAIAQEIRNGLKKSGALGASVGVTQLIDKGWTPEQSKDVLNYEVGDYISLSREYRGSALRRGEFYRVACIEGDSLILESVKGDRFTLDPMTCYEKTAFSSREFDIAVGDSLRWTSTNKKKGATNGATFEITAIDGKNAKAIDADGKERRINLSNPLAVDYTLTSTSYRAQGSDRPRVFVSATSDSTSNREPFYVSISRQVHELKIWTQDTAALARRVAQSSVQANPLELLGVNQNGRPRQDQSHSSTAQPDRAAAHRQQCFNSADSYDDAAATIKDDKQHRGGIERDSIRQVDGATREEIFQNGHWGNAQGIDGRDHTEHQSIDPDSAENRRAGNTDQDLEELASLIQQHQIEQALAEPLHQLRDNLDRLQAVQQQTNKSLTEMVQSAKVEVLATAIHEWRDTRALHDELQLMELASKIQALRESQSISQGVELHKLATLVRDFKAETAIAHALVQLEEVIAPKAAPDPFLMRSIELVFINNGKRQPDGSSLVSGTTWEFKRQDDHLIVTEQRTKAIAFEVKDGRVVKDDGAKALKARMEQLRDKTVQLIKDDMLNSTTEVQPRRGRGR
jgi:conjugative relaxase-like TrwC/TraI family protein